MTGLPPPLNLVLGDCAAAALRQAASDHGLVGAIHTIPDDLGHGPLDDGAPRLAYMRACFVGCAEWTDAGTDAFAAWDALEAALRAKPRDVLVWRARNVSETVLLAMACWRLRQMTCRVLVVEPPGGRHTSLHAPDALARMQSSMRAICDRERADLAATFERLRDDGGVRRQWINGNVETVPASAFDQLMLDAVPAEWEPAARVVGRAMSRADHRDGLSDIFLCSRLQALIAASRVEADRKPTSMPEYSVRLSRSI